MMGKGFLGKRTRSLAGAARNPLRESPGTLVAAEIRDVRVAATETGTRVVLDLSGPVTHKAFLLDDPSRVVLDVLEVFAARRSCPRPKASITAMRSGKLPHSGLRLVFEVTGPVTFQTSAAAPSGDAGHRLILDIAGAAAARESRGGDAGGSRRRRWRSVPRMRPANPAATS